MLIKMVFSSILGIVQLHTKVLVTVRDTSAGCHWNTRQLHIAGAINI